MGQTSETKQLSSMNDDVLKRLVEYCKYLYEEEKSRTERIEHKMNVFGVALGTSVVVILGCLPLARMSDASKIPGIWRIVLAVPLGICIFLLVLCALYVFRVYRVQRFERLSDPREMSIRAMSMNTKSEILSAIIADYAVATNRNHEINEGKADDLSRALGLLLAALMVFIATLFCLNALVLWCGGS